jgi:hypothetical protein
MPQERDSIEKNFLSLRNYLGAIPERYIALNP